MRQSETLIVANAFDVELGVRVDVQVNASDSWSVSVIRAILAALIAISLVVVPAMPADLASMSGVEMAMGDQGDTPCCPCCDTQDNSKASVSCAIKCISVFVAMLPLTAPLPDAVKAAPIAGLADALREHVRSPPTHPPPV